MITARVLSAYEASGKDELSLMPDELVLIRYDKTLPAGWVMAERQGRRGRVPLNNLDI
jgi:hypothetical protein